MSTTIIRADCITFASGPSHSIEQAGLTVFAMAQLFRTRYPGERLDSIGYRYPTLPYHDRKHHRHLAAIARRITDRKVENDA